MAGWIKLHRTIEANKMWTSEPFSRGQAWVDLLLLANFIDSFYYKRGYKIEVLRGQVGRSTVELADRWKWSRGKVQRFLNDLQNEQQIEQQNSNITTIISIVNYNIYQGDEQQIEQQTDTKRTADRQQTDTYKNVKNDKNEKEFKEEVLSYSNEYDDLMLKDFFLYWSEWNKSKTKMRWQMEKTWQTSRRIGTWFNRSKDFKKTVATGRNPKSENAPAGYGERSSTAVQRGEYLESKK